MSKKWVKINKLERKKIGKNKTSVGLPRINNPILILIKKGNVLLKNTHSMAVMSWCSMWMFHIWSSQCPCQIWPNISYMFVKQKQKTPNGAAGTKKKEKRRVKNNYRVWVCVLQGQFEPSFHLSMVLWVPLLQCPSFHNCYFSCSSYMNQDTVHPPALQIQSFWSDFIIISFLLCFIFFTCINHYPYCLICMNVLVTTIWHVSRF